MTAKIVIASAERLIEVRHFWRNRNRIAEMSVPACPIPTQNTKFVMSHAHPTGTFRPQMPIPSQKSHEMATPSSPSSATEGMKKNHQPIGVRRSTASATTSVIEWKSGERRISVGRPATGLSRSSASVWAKLFPAFVAEEWPKRGRFYHRASRESSSRLRQRVSSERTRVRRVGTNDTGVRPMLAAWFEARRPAGRALDGRDSLWRRLCRNLTNIGRRSVTEVFLVIVLLATAAVVAAGIF